LSHCTLKLLSLLFFISFILNVVEYSAAIICILHLWWQHIFELYTVKQQSLISIQFMEPTNRGTFFNRFCFKWAFSTDSASNELFQQILLQMSFFNRFCFKW
jgi:hypothetical protein